MATHKLAAWSAQLRYANLPSEVVLAARRSLVNYIGCAIAGSDHPAVLKAHSALKPLFGPSTSTLLGSGGGRVDLQHAALLNGIASHVHDYDDTHLETIIHPTGPVASALLAYAEYASETINGQDLLCALVAGIEAESKLGLAVWPDHYDIGWHITSTTGSIGAAVGLANLMRLDVATTQHAIGIAAVQVTGLREMFGSDTKSFHPGRAAQNGTIAALLASKGYTSSEKALEAKRGWANVVAGGGTPRLDEYVDQLGDIWEISKNAFKPFPCGIVCHPAIDACIQLHPKVDTARIVKIEQRVHPLVIELTSKRTPRDGLEAKFSVFHGCAVGLLYGKAGPAEYRDEVVTSDEVVQLRDKIDTTADEGIRADEAVIVVHFEDGSTVESHIQHAVGSLEVPMTDQQLKSKFVDQARLVIQDKAEEAWDLAWSIGDSKDVAEVIRSL